jgi:predicted ATP-grasp superfamily ATP-dependent carboligase
MSSVADNAFLLLSGYNQRAVIAFCRQLSVMGIPFHIIALSDADPILSSRYSKNVKAVRHHDSLHLEEIIKAIIKIQQETGTSILTIAPSSEFLNQFLLANRIALEEIGCRIPLVDEELYHLITNKYSFSTLCREHGIAVPNKKEALIGSEFPVVAKPLVNITAQGTSLYPYIIRDSSELACFLEKENVEDFYFEEFITGDSYYVLLNISGNGSTASFSQKNILQQADGKSIILAEPSNIHTNPRSLKLICMLQSIGFRGLIMIEVRTMGDELCVIEANPRLWGPLQLVKDNASNVLSEYINDALRLKNDKEIYQSGIQMKNYFWLNGLIEMIVAKKEVVNFAQRKSLFFLVVKNILHDVYLRKDTIKIFFGELKGIVKG